MPNPLECPKCGYERKASDSSPLSQCPACGLVFARFRPARLAAAEQDPPNALNVPSAPSTPTRFTRKTVLLAVLGVLIVVFAIDGTRMGSSQERTDRAALALARHGQQIAATSEPGVLTFRSSQKTTDAPRRAYKVVFLTRGDSMLSDPDGGTSQSGFLRNRGLALAWKAKFCTADLSSVMRQYGIGMVSGQVLDLAGDIQAIAICNE